MKKSKIFTLKNGLKIIFYQDKSKHATIATLYVKFGGGIKELKLGDETFTIKDGTAHFIEHLLIEHSIYGNSTLEFEKKVTDFNGFTNKDFTWYYINSVLDFDEDLVKLINIVNKPCFNDNDIAETKPAIIKEIMSKKDNKWDDLNKKSYECLFKNIEYSNTLGETADIESINYDYIKTCYDMLYNPQNQILCIYGNFNIRKIKALIEETYNKINKEKMEYKLIKNNEPNEVFKSNDYIKKDINKNYVRLNYKVDISHLSNKEKVKLTFYISYFLKYLFGPSSKLYNDLVKEKICDYNIDFYCFKEDRFFIIQIGLFTDNEMVFIDRVKKIIEDRKLSKKDFEIQKKNSILDVILREDNTRNIVLSLINNILDYDYYLPDTIEDINEQNFNDYKCIINNLDFSNYCIVRMVKNK